MQQLVHVIKKFCLNPVFLTAILVLALIFLADRSIERNIFMAGQFALTSISPDQESTNASMVWLPYMASSTADKEHVYNGKVLYSKFGNTRFQFIPDDNLRSIAINGQKVDLSSINTGQLRDWSRGFIIDLAQYLTNGENSIQVDVLDEGAGQFGLTVNSAPYFWAQLPTIALYILLMAAVLALFFFVFRKLNFGRVPSAILLLSIFVHLIFLANVKFSEYTYDLREGGTGHLNYIEYIVDNGALPSPDGWSYYHPPLYYLTAALVYKIADMADIQSVYKVVQGLSLLYFIGFLVFAFLIVRRYIKNPLILNAVIAILAFWPAGFIHSIRIGNDIGFIFFYTAALYFINEWYLNGKSKLLYWGSALSALAILTKVNGILLAGIIGIVILVRLFQDKDKWLWARRGILALAICFAGYFLGSVDNYNHVLKQGRKDWVFAGFLNISPADPSLYCVNRPINYVYFDVFTFIGQPYISTRGDMGMRQYFWNFLYKTSLFGEFSFNSPFHRITATAISVLFLIVLCLFWFGVFYWIWRYYRKSDLRRFQKAIRNPHQYSVSLISGGGRIPLLLPSAFLKKLVSLRKENGFRNKYLVLFLSFALMALGLLALRLKVSMPCLGDFRYVFPMIVSFAVFYAMIAEKLLENKWTFLLWAALAAGFGFAMFSGLFYLTVS